MNSRNLFSALSLLVALGAVLLLAWAIGLVLKSNALSPAAPVAQMEPTITEPPWLTYLPPVKATAEKSWLETQEASPKTPSIESLASATPDIRPTMTPDYSVIPHRTAGAGVILDQQPFWPPTWGYLIVNQWNAYLNGENIYVYAGAKGEEAPPMQGAILILKDDTTPEEAEEYLTPFQDGPMQIIDVQGQALLVLESSWYHKYTILFDVEHRLFQVPTVTPLLDCILPNYNGYTAFFGYSNFNAYTLTIPLGPDNFFWPDPQDRGQPTVFPPGQYAQVFSVPVGGGGGTGPLTADDVVWTLNGLTAGASGSSPQCP